ncbi:hypothetical protein [Massilia sp. S19_KUP03_FR1]|uniref:hypothetical protein n=1 Tax=Massilia sp. S19_KUP03_FR1 TaxID=3025503 RepID=UPI002FCD9573
MLTMTVRRLGSPRLPQAARRFIPYARVKITPRLKQLYLQTWDSPYAVPLDITRQYPRPRKSA